VNRRRFLAGALALAVAPTDAIAAARGELAEFLARAYREQLASDPTLASTLGYLPPGGGPHTEWTRRTDDWYRNRTRDAKRRLERIDAIDPRGDASPYDRTLYRLTQRTIIDDETWRHHRVPFFGGVSPHLSAPTHLVEYQPVNSVEDAEAYLERASEIPALLDVEAHRMRACISAGCPPPEFNFAGLVRSANAAADAMARSGTHPLYEDFRDKCASAKLPARLGQALLEQLGRLLRTDLSNAVRGFAAELDRQGEEVDDDHGAWALPDGDVFYRSELARHCTALQDPDELHDWGLSEVARLKGELQDVARTVGYTADRPFLEFLSTDSLFTYADSPRGRAEYLADASRYVEEIRGAMRLLTASPPSAEMEIRSVDPAAAAGGGRAYYVGPAEDGSRPGIFFLNTLKAAQSPRYQVQAVCYHEAIPGHHLQAAAALDADLPDFRKHLYLGAYAEGWALYAESFPKELGFYQDPYQDAGRIALELFRAVRVVIDTGIHHKRWSFNRALGYMNENTGNARADNVVEVERYFNWPGQAVSYKVGMREMLRLRSSAETRLGPEFSLPAFHAAVLASGSLTLPLLEANIDRYIERVSAGTR